MAMRELTITLVGVKQKSKGSYNPSNNMNELGWGNGHDEDFMEDDFGPPNQRGNRGPKGPGPINNRNRHYQNAYGNYRGGYGPQGEYGPPEGPPPMGFGQGPMFGPRPFFGPEPNFGMGPNFGPRPNFAWGKGFGPDGPPNQRHEQSALRFLSRCGVSKENIRNLPRAILQLIEPNYCGLCSVNLETFPVARMHYVSKNHQKNQRKWLSNQSEMGGQGGQHRKEPPVKSRDLYCELCDVHITSKTHADSHYAGKPHRAIVEGRKLAKNPMLLQRGMENRLEMLIRREKKHLKADDVAPKEEPKLNKSIAPELYCEICQTSVTCSEQMTMHLNGKRHLTKEKQHILKMMTGQPAGSNAADEVNDEEEDEEETADNAEAAADGDGKKDDYDWGNGSGNWDEPAAKE